MQELDSRLQPEQVESFARLALAGIGREFPYKPGHVVHGPEDLLPQRERHPVFYGCFDWHSAVHGHWLLVRLLRLHPEAPVAPEIERALNEAFVPALFEREAAFFRDPRQGAFERGYGWAWLLRLAAELGTWQDGRARRWAHALRPLETEVARLATDHATGMLRPHRTGLHGDSAFSLAFYLDYARALGNATLERAARERAAALYAADRDYPFVYEPSAFDFFSAGLNEADLMRRVLDPAAYSTWLGAFFPTLSAGRLGSLLEPVVVPDMSDGHLAHLAGLGLSRAWTMEAIAAALPPADRRRAVLLAGAESNGRHGLAHVVSGHYAGDHWLATFAVYWLAGAAFGANATHE